MDGMGIDVFFKICGAALLAVIVIAVLSEVSKSAKIPVKLGGTVLLYGGALLLILPLISRLSDMAEGYALVTYGELMLKCLGIALIAQIVADLCRDIGEGTAGSIVEMAAKAVILLLALPTVESLIGTVEGLLSS